MMKYEIRTSVKFEADFDAIVGWICRYSLKNAAMVVDSVNDAVDSLEIMPERCQYAREKEKHDRLAVLNLRQIVVKNHRIIFAIKEDAVYLLAISHCRQNMRSAEDVLSS